MNWGSYIGLPYYRGGRTREGLDCYGLLRLYLQEAGVLLPAHHDTFDFQEITHELALQISSGHWQPIDRDARRTYDAVTMWAFPLINGRHVKLPCHIAVLTDKDHILDIDEGKSSLRIRIDHPLYKNRVIGFYRHEQLA